jgi:FtsZ-binding cell division protein ZapB
LHSQTIGKLTEKVKEAILSFEQNLQLEINALKCNL